MTDQFPDDLEQAVQDFVSSWPKDAFKEEHDESDIRTYIIGNLRGFAEHLRRNGFRKVGIDFSRIQDDVWTEL